MTQNIVTNIGGTFTMFIDDIFVLSISCLITCYGISNYNSNPKDKPRGFSSKYIEIVNKDSYKKIIAMSQVFLGLIMGMYLLCMRLGGGKWLFSIMGIAFVGFFIVYWFKLIRCIRRRSTNRNTYR